jgi:hypothetical protein
MSKNLIILTSLGVLMSLSCASKPASQASGVKLSWRGSQEKRFADNLEVAFERLNTFLKEQNLAQTPIENLVDEVIHFESKELFDSEMMRLTNGQMESIPRTYVAVGDGGVLRIVSLNAYLKIHPEHAVKDYINILVHESAHIFHSKTYGDEGMGPIWFFEGFAIVAADQYVDEVNLSKDEMEAVAESKVRGDYKKYGFMIRELNKTYSLKDMLQRAKDEPNKFLSYLGLN